MNSSRTRQAPAFILALSALVATLLVVVSAATADPSIESKRAQARAVLAQVRESDAQLELAIEAYNFANGQLEQIDADLTSNARHLVVAKQSLAAAQEHIADRLRSLYVNGDGGGTVEVLLGAEGLDDLLGRLDMVERVGDQDARVLGKVKVYRKEVKERRARLETSRVAQARLVADKESTKASIERQLAERERTLAAFENEIRQLQAEEARRQARIVAQARARLAAEQQSGIETLDLGSTGDGFSEGYFGTPPPAQYGGVVGIAMQYLGVPYRWGGSSPSSGFDCSGLVQYVFNQVGVTLPHHAASIYGYGTPVSQSELEPGDLVFYRGLGHMGIYIGGSQYIHAPQTGDVVKISSIYRSGWVGAKRL